MPNAPEIVELLVGGALIGATMVPINTRFKPRELRHVITDARLARGLHDRRRSTSTSTSRRSSTRRCPASSSPPTPTRVAARRRPGAARGRARRRARRARAAERARRLRELAAGAGRPPRRDDLPDPDDSAADHVHVRHDRAPEGLHALAPRDRCSTRAGIAERFAIPADERWWDPLPMFHAGALLLMTACFVAGATFISMPHFERRRRLRPDRARAGDRALPAVPDDHADADAPPALRAARPLARARVVVNVGPARHAAPDPGRRTRRRS